MNMTRWAFLYTGVQRNELQRMEITQTTLARALGLHVVPVQGPDGRLRMPQKFDEMISLLPAIARREYMGAVLQKLDEMEKQDAIASEVGAVPAMLPPLSDETGLEILDRPIDLRRMSVAEQRQALAAMGIQEKPPELPPELTDENPKAGYRDPGRVPRPKLKMDD